MTSTRPVTRQRRPGRLLRRLGIAVGAAIAVGFAPWVWMAVTARGGVHELADAPAAPVTLVLGAGLNPDGTPSPFLAGRLDVAKALLDSGRTQVLLVSGDNRHASYDEPTAMRDYLLARGVPGQRIVRDFAGRDTYDSCARAQRIFGVDRLLVVSQGFHLPRAVATCRALGLDAQGVGDWSVQGHTSTWTWGEWRERAAAWKAVVDLTTRRDPVLGPPETAVQDALTAASG